VLHKLAPGIPAIDLFADALVSNPKAPAVRTVVWFIHAVAADKLPSFGRENAETRPSNRISPRTSARCTPAMAPTGEAAQVPSYQVIVSRTMRSAYWLNHDPNGMVEALVRGRCQNVRAHYSR
jgi:hypothetical protein